jgi:hypothetical protein
MAKTILKNTKYRGKTGERFWYFRIFQNGEKVHSLFCGKLYHFAIRNSLLVFGLAEGWASIGIAIL